MRSIGTKHPHVTEMFDTSGAKIEFPPVERHGVLPETRLADG